MRTRAGAPYAGDTMEPVPYGREDPRLFEPLRPEDARPPLRWWSHVWRLLLCGLLSFTVWSNSAADEWHHQRWLFWVEIGLGLAAYVLVFWRRRWPTAVALATACMASISGIAAGPASLAAVSLATLRRPWPILAVAATTMAGGVVYAEVAPDQDIDPIWLGPLLNAVFTAGMLGWGMYIGSRRELLAALHQRALRAEAEQALRTQQAQISERGRIAREMHDVLAHRISQISMQAGALTFRDDLEADALRTGVGEIQDNANAALADLRSVLGVLRGDTPAGLDRPLPTYADLGELVQEATASGMQIGWYDALVGEPPKTAGRTLYRLIQEGITNARKHAPGARLTIELSGDEHLGITLELRNPIGFAAPRPAVPGAGVGLIGMAERVALRGGTLEHSSGRERFVLKVWLPWDG